MKAEIMWRIEILFKSVKLVGSKQKVRVLCMPFCWTQSDWYFMWIEKCKGNMQHSYLQFCGYEWKRRMLIYLFFLLGLPGHSGCLHGRSWLCLWDPLLKSMHGRWEYSFMQQAILVAPEILILEQAVNALIIQETLLGQVIFFHAL